MLNSSFERAEFRAWTSRFRAWTSFERAEFRAWTSRVSSLNELQMSQNFKRAELEQLANNKLTNRAELEHKLKLDSNSSRARARAHFNRAEFEHHELELGSARLQS